MKKMRPILISVILASLAVPAVGADSWRIHLKNGGTFTTLRYWREGGEVRFYIYGGVMGIQKHAIKTIKKVVPENVRYARSDSDRKTPEPSSETNNLEGEKEGGKIDIASYKEKKEQLAAELERALERLREATSRRDPEAKEREQREMRRLTAEINTLTEEVKLKNNGKVPEGWWKEE